MVGPVGPSVPTAQNLQVQCTIVLPGQLPVLAVRYTPPAAVDSTQLTAVEKLTKNPSVGPYPTARSARAYLRP